MEVLTQAQVALGGLDRGVAERDLDLLERRAALVGELGEGAPQVVRRDPDADPVTVSGDGLEDRLRPERARADAATLRDAAQHGSGVDAGGRGPGLRAPRTPAADPAGRGRAGLSSSTFDGYQRKNSSRARR